MTRPRAQGFHDFISTSIHHPAANGYPEQIGDPIGLIAAILDKTPRLDGAACAGSTNPDMWFAPPGTAERAQAQRICAICPTRQACTTLGDTNDEQGVWGAHNHDDTANPDMTGRCDTGHSLAEHGRIIRPRNSNPYVRCLACTPPPAPPAPKTHCIRGHEYTPENTAIVRGGKARACRACKRERQRGYRAAEQNTELKALEAIA